MVQVAALARICSLAEELCALGQPEKRQKKGRKPVSMVVVMMFSYYTREPNSVYLLYIQILK